MDKHEFDIYAELYKRKEYKRIPIGKYPDGEYFYMTDKQVRTMELIADGLTTNIGYGGSARCFTGETLVQTIAGHKQIKDIIEGDYVLSINLDTNEREYKIVNKKYTFVLEEPPKIAIFANNLKCTYNHEFLFKGKWTKAFELRKRKMETGRRPLSYFKFRETGNRKLEEHRQIKSNETGTRCKRLSKNNGADRRDVQNNQNAPVSCTSIHSEPREQTLCKSQEFYKRRQPVRKPRVDNMARECPTFSGCREAEHVQEGRKTTHKLLKAWRGQWKSYFNRRNSKGHKTEIQTESLYPADVSRRIRSKSLYDKGCHSKEVLVSREITGKEITGIKFEYLDTPVYDLCVADNHNYTVTKDNIIVHNSGKSIIECTAIIFDCLSYPDIAWGLARKELTTLKRTVLLTLFNQLAFYGFTDKDYTYNQQLNKISFKNKSDIFLIDSMYKPSDPLNTRFGGFELTRCAIDESNETDVSVVNKLFERTGWRNNEKYGLKRKLFECFNPAKNHVYTRFYIPFRDKTEQSHSIFIPALPTDNPNPAVQEWVEDLIKIGDEVTMQRQIYGNFDYDDDPSALCDYDSICDLFTNDHIQGGTRTISADLAMQGRDKFVAGYWNGMICHVAIDMSKSSATQIESKLKELKIVNSVGNSNIVADSDGLGAYLESYIRNIKTFHGGSTKMPKKFKKEYGNLKDACGFKLAEMINTNKIKIICSAAQEEIIKRELSICLKRDNVDLDKKKLIKKDQMKKLLGNSPDYLDMLLMNMIFLIKKKRKSIY